MFIILKRNYILRGHSHSARIADAFRVRSSEDARSQIKEWVCSTSLNSSSRHFGFCKRYILECGAVKFFVVTQINRKTSECPPRRGTSQGGDGARGGRKAPPVSRTPFLLFDSGNIPTFVGPFRTRPLLGAHVGFASYVACTLRSDAVCCFSPGATVRDG